MVFIVCKGGFLQSSPGSGGFSTAPRALGGGHPVVAGPGAAWLAVQPRCSPCCFTKPCCVFSSRFSGEPTRTVSALFPPLPSLPAWVPLRGLAGRVKEQKGEQLSGCKKNAFLFTWERRHWGKEPGQGLGCGLPPIHQPHTTQDRASSEPFCPHTQGLSAAC